MFAQDLNVSVSVMAVTLFHLDLDPLSFRAPVRPSPLLSFLSLSLLPAFCLHLIAREAACRDGLLIALHCVRMKMWKWWSVSGMERQIVRETERDLQTRCPFVSIHIVNPFVLRPVCWTEIRLCEQQHYCPHPRSLAFTVLLSWRYRRPCKW